MIEFICLFFPALLTIKRGEYIESKFKIVKKYVFFAILINLVNLLLVYIEHDFTSINLLECFNQSGFALKYLACGLIFSYVLPKLVSLIKNNIKFSIKGKNNVNF